MYPSETKTLLIAFVISGIIGGGLALAFEFVDDTVRTPQDLERLPTDTRFLGWLPLSTGDNSRIVLESLLSIKTQLASLLPNHENRAILVTSGSSGEGKSFFAYHLAGAIALCDKKVLLIEADLRRPSMKELSGVKGKVGVAELIQGKANLSEVIQQTSNKNLHIIVAGKPASVPHQYLEHSRLEKCLKESSQEFRWIIVDTPPLSAASDALLLSKRVSGVVFVTKFRESRIRTLRHLISEFSQIETPRLGFVINGVNMRSSYSSYYKEFYAYEHNAAHRASS